jgi:AcrR family transcriptional regulator
MNIAATSRQAILAQGRKLVMENGISAISMRSVAQACGVAVGTIYNYFPSKTELIAGTVESVWNDIFRTTEEAERLDRFTDAVQWVFDRLCQSRVTYPGFFTLHAMSFAPPDKSGGRQMMLDYFGRIKKYLLEILERDEAIKPGTFGEGFSPQSMIDLVFATVVSLTLRQEDDIQPLIGLLRRALY